MPLEEKHAGFYDVFAASRANILQNIAIYTAFLRMRRKHSVLRRFFNKGLYMYRKYHGFIHFLLPVLKANQPRTLVFTVFHKTNMQKNTMFWNNFSQFSSWCSSIQKTIIFYSIFATAHPDSRRC